MQAELASLIDPTNRPPELDARFFLWAADDGTGPRAIDDPSDPSGWFARLLEKNHRGLAKRAVPRR